MSTAFWQSGKRPLYRKQTEDNLQLRVCTYLKRYYPGTIFTTEFTAGRIGLTPNQAKRYAAMQSGPGFPDIFIFARSSDGAYAGLGLELKAAGTTIILKTGAQKGSMTANPHIRMQAAVHEKLQAAGFKAVFVIGYDEAIRVIDDYFGTTTVQLEF